MFPNFIFPVYIYDPKTYSLFEYYIVQSLNNNYYYVVVNYKLATGVEFVLIKYILEFSTNVDVNLIK